MSLDKCVRKMCSDNNEFYILLMADSVCSQCMSFMWALVVRSCDIHVRHVVVRIRAWFLANALTVHEFHVIVR